MLSLKAGMASLSLRRITLSRPLLVRLVSNNYTETDGAPSNTNANSDFRRNTRHFPSRRVNNRSSYQSNENERVRSNRGTIFRGSENSPTEQSIDFSLTRVDQEIRKVGRISRGEIEEILQDIREMKSATSSQSLMIIRCCGELLPEETAENRTKLVQDIWKTMEALNVPVDISHYNALLRVYLDNEYKFNPTEFLQQLDAKGIEPNRVTYQRLIARFCQDGDIEGASTILQHMKEKQLPINSHVFNALILGHAQAGDMESAEGIIGVMKQAGLDANDDTYGTLMKGYARQGDIENIRRIKEECEKNDIFLVDKDFLEVIYTLASTGHENLVDELIPYLKKHAGFNQDVTNVILRLINIGQEDIAFKLLLEMPRAMRMDQLAPSGNFFIKQLVLSSTPSETVIKYCHEMVKRDLNKQALLRACEWALGLKKFEKAFDFLEALNQSGFPIRQHYVWPFFASSKSIEDVYEGLKCMNYLGMGPSVETMREYIIPALNRHLKPHEKLETLLERLSAHTRIPMGNIVPAAIQSILQNGKMEQAASLARKYRVRLNNVGTRRALADAYFSTGNTKALVEIVGSAVLDGDEVARENVGAVLMELTDRTRKPKVEFLSPILKELLNRGLGITNSAAEFIQNALGDQLTQEVANDILALTSGDLVPNVELYYEPRRGDQNQDYQPAPAYPGFDAAITAGKSVEEIERLIQLHKQQGKPYKGLQRALFTELCRLKEVEKVEALQQELINEGFTFPPGLQALLLEMYSLTDRVEDAKRVHREYLASYTLDDVKILKFAQCLVNAGQYSECVEMIRNQERDEARKPRTGYQSALVWKILNQVAEKGKVQEVQDIYKALYEKNLMQVTNVVLGPLVNVHLVNGDLQSALTEFERCVKEHNCTPWKQALFRAFIKNDDPDNLQKVLDLSTEMYGEVNSLYDLVFAFLDCGKVRQAKKILETPGLRARNEKLESTCQQYVDENRVADLESLIDITREIVNVDRNNLYFYLLKAYCKSENPAKALSIWTSLQEENIQPSEELLIYLADFLQKNNMEVPFVVPDAKSASEAEVLDESLVAEFRKSLDENLLERALEIKQKFDVSGLRLSYKDQSNLVEGMTRAERLIEATRLTEEMLQAGGHPQPHVLKFLVARLSIAGELDLLKRLGSVLPENMKKQSLFNTRMCVAHVNAGEGVEFFRNVIKPNIEELVSGETSTNDNMNIPVTGAVSILLRNDELLPEFQELAERASSVGLNHLHNAVWNYYLIKKDFNSAKEIWDSKLKSSSRILFRGTLVQARMNQDEQLITEVWNQVGSSETLTQSSRALALEFYVDLLCTKNKAEEALKAVETYLDRGGALQFVNIGTLEGLKEKLQANNLPFPYEIPTTGRRKRFRKNREDTNSSSDSDSD